MPCHSHLVLSLFFSFSYGHHRDLHSFPTRRSSDLSGPTAAWPRPSSSASVRLGDPLVNSAPSASSTMGATRDAPRKSTRSEEHTSELQSPDHLVCRLLLEKKKQKNTRDNEKTRILI